MRPFSARPLFRNLSLIFFLALTAFTARALPADTPSLDDSLRQLVDRVAAIPNLHGPLRLQFFQDPAFEADTGKDWQSTVRKEFEAHHLSLSDDPAATLLRIGLAETPTQLVLSAATRIGDKDEVRFLTLPRTAFRAANLPAVPVRIERQLIYQSPDRILDASSNGPQGGLILLLYRAPALSVLRFDSSGQLTQTIALSPANFPPSRDPRAELTVRADDGTILLPAKTCDFSWAASTEPKCRPAIPVWRATTVLTPSCDAGGWKLLADGPDYSTPDVLQVLPDSSLRQGSAALLSDFPGPILGINAGQTPASALVVTKNLQTGNYEVYKITLACGN